MGIHQVWHRTELFDDIDLAYLLATGEDPPPKGSETIPPSVYQTLIKIRKYKEISSSIHCYVSEQLDNNPSAMARYSELDRAEAETVMHRDVIRSPYKVCEVLKRQAQAIAEDLGLRPDFLFGDTQATRVNSQTSPFSVPHGTVWRDIQFIIRNPDYSEIVEVRAHKKHLGNYGPNDLGFCGRGENDFGRLWPLFKLFAKNGGEVHFDDSVRMSELKKPISDLRRLLRGLFPGIEDQGHKDAPFLWMRPPKESTNFDGKAPKNRSAHLGRGWYSVPTIAFAKHPNVATKPDEDFEDLYSHRTELDVPQDQTAGSHMSSHTEDGDFCERCLEKGIHTWLDRRNGKLEPCSGCASRNK